MASDLTYVRSLLFWGLMGNLYFPEPILAMHLKKNVTVEESVVHITDIFTDHDLFRSGGIVGAIGSLPISSGFKRKGAGY